LKNKEENISHITQTFEIV